MMTSKILKLADSWKTQKSKYLENETQFFPLVKKFINCILKGNIIADLTFNSAQEFVKIKSWLLLIFSLCLHNQLKFHNSIELKS